MMPVKKLLLASAIAALSSPTLALQTMDDAALSETTGQDGLTIGVTATIGAFDIILHDLDGFTGATAAGGIKLEGVTTGTSPIGLTIEVDAGSSAVSATDATLQVKVYNTAAINLTLGTLKAGNSNRDATTPGWGLSFTTGVLANLGSVTIGATSATAPLLNVQMGNEPQGAWMKLTPTFTGGGIVLNNFSLNDGGGSFTGGAIGAVKTEVLDKGAASGTGSLGADINVDATAANLRLGITKLGAAGAAGGMDVRMTDVKLGDQAVTTTIIGDVEIVGLNLNGSVITIAGH